MFGIDLHSEYAFLQISLLVFLISVLFLDSYSTYKERKAALLSQRQISGMLRKMLDHHTDQCAFREQYEDYRRRGLKTPAVLLAAMAHITSMKHHLADGNYYFYNDDSGFMTVIPGHHVQH